MSSKKSTKIIRKIRAIFASFLLLVGVASSLSAPILSAETVYAEPNDAVNITEDNDADNNEGTSTTNNEQSNTSDNQQNNSGNNQQETTSDNRQNDSDGQEDSEDEQKSADGCKESLGAIGWLVCPTTGKIAEAVDWIYDRIEAILVIKPISTEDGTPVYEIWKYCLGFANIMFVIFMLIVIYSQITGVGISNYGIKKVLPKLIITAILVNLSFLICLLAVDMSNILGNSIRGLFNSVEESALQASSMEMGAISYTGAYSALIGGSLLTVGAATIAFDLGMIWMLIPTVLGALVAVITGLITVSLRQAMVVLLVMVSPLAMVAAILPNTEKWYRKWKDMLIKMLVFYPMFSLLFGASSLAGFAIIMSSKDGFGVILGMAVQIFPLFFSWKLMQMSGTILGNINAGLRNLTSKPLATNRAWAESHKLATKQKRLASNRPTTPSLRLMQFVAKRKVAREADITDSANLIKQQGLAYRAGKNWRGRNATGTPTSRGRRAYENQARSLEYQQVIERDKNTMNKGLGYLAKEGSAEKAKLDRLDAKMINAALTLKTEQARGAKIEYENSQGMHKMMQNAINAHMDDKNGYKLDSSGKKTAKSNYKFHFDPNDPERMASLARYNAMHQIMEGKDEDVHFAAATSAQAYDTQKKIVETKMQKYFDMTIPTKDVDNRLAELTMKAGAAGRIDSIIPGLRILNQRGDTDLVQKHLDSLLDKKISGGIELGTHASQSLASFLMFEVKDGDPFLRRFGKYINLETANAYNKNERKVMNVDYGEYIRGYHDGEADLVSEKNPTGRMYAKKGAKQLMEGTPLDGIERTALSNFDDSLKKAYGYNKERPEAEWDVKGWLKKREEIQTAFEPAFLSASLKWLSGSEQINSGVKFWTGYERKQKKDEKGHTILNEKKEPVYELTAVWDGEEFAKHKDDVRAYYQRKTNDYFKDQTAGQILGMRSDYRDAMMEHLVQSYLDADGDEELSEERRREYRNAEAEIQTRYGDKSAEKAKEDRDKDLHKLKMDLAGRQVRKILGETGKLKQIYRTRTSGTAINAKDWLRQWVNLDDEEALRKEMIYYDEKRKARSSRTKEGETDDGKTGGIYDEGDKERFLNEIRDLKDRVSDVDTESFYEAMSGQLKKWFGEDASIVKKYEHYYKKDFPTADNSELYNYLRELLNDLDNY